MNLLKRRLVAPRPLAWLFDLFIMGFGMATQYITSTKVTRIDLRPQPSTHPPIMTYLREKRFWQIEHS